MALVKSKPPGPRELLIFGMLLPLFFGAVGFLVGRGSSEFASYAIWAAGALVALTYLLWPASRLRILNGWMAATYPLRWLVSHVLLVLMFAIAITPFAVVLRFRGFDPLGLRAGRRRESYWEPRKQSAEAGSYLRQY